MTEFRKIFPFCKKHIIDNRIGICEQRIDMLEDQITELEEIIINKIIDILKQMR